MKLKQLIRGIEGIEVRGSKEVEILGISADSRTVSPGSLFIARKGEAYDGNAFIRKALDAGAAAIVTDFFDPFLKIPQAIHPDPGKIEARLAAKYYGNPSKELFLVGITGTKGKTTTSYLVRHLLSQLGLSCGLAGTVETIYGEMRSPARLTTHDAIFNQKLLREMASHQCQAAVMEVSSHGLDQGRVAEIAFDIGLFTNLFPDHLDYHKSIEEYAAAKRKLFENLKGTAILNADSPWCSFMKLGPSITFGIEKIADVQARDVQFTSQGSSFTACGTPFHIPLMGRFNIYNALGAIAVGLERKADLQTISEALRSFDRVPGRLEEISNNRGISVFVDYAHNGEALENVLSTLREIAKKRILLVFGCGGNRDPRRRNEMGMAAEKGADLSIVTTDNPRSENPETIASQILEGFQKKDLVLLEPDRKKAIALAIEKAEAGDIVLIAGKGHEKVQIFANQTIPFDDVQIAKEALQNR